MFPHFLAAQEASFLGGGHFIIEPFVGPFVADQIFYEIYLFSALFGEELQQYCPEVVEQPDITHVSPSLRNHMAHAEITELLRIIRLRAPVLQPTAVPCHSDAAGVDVASALEGMLSTERQRKDFRNALSYRKYLVTKQAGGTVHLVMKCDIDVRQRVVHVIGLYYASPIEATLLSAKKFMEKQLTCAPRELEPYVFHFLSTNGYDGADVSNGSVNDVYASACALQVLLDAIPGWATRLGSYEAPLGADVAVGPLLDALFNFSKEPCAAKSLKKRRHA